MSIEKALTLVPLIQVVPSQLPHGVTVSRLPVMLDAAIAAVAHTGVTVGGYYLVDAPYSKIRGAVNRLAVPYHTYAVEVLGDRCTLKNCVEHGVPANVISLFRNGGE